MYISEMQAAGGSYDLQEYVFHMWSTVLALYYSS
jgi:hypothetical protein